MGADLEPSNDKPLRGRGMGCVGVWVCVGRSGRDSWTLTTQLGLKPRGCTHTGLSHSYIPQGGVGSGFSLHGTGRHAIKTQSESRHFVSHLSLQIVFSALSKSLDLLLRRHPLPGPWFGCNSRDGGTQGQLSLSPPPTNLYPHN